MVGLESFLLLVPGRWAACWSSNPKAPGSFVRGLMPLRGGKTVSFGQVPARYLQLHLHQEDSVMVGEDLVYSLTVTLL